LKIRSKVEVATFVLPPPSSELMARNAWKDSRLLVSGPPLCSVPPIIRLTTERASRTPDVARVAHRKR